MKAGSRNTSRFAAVNAYAEFHSDDLGGSPGHSPAGTNWYFIPKSAVQPNDAFFRDSCDSTKIQSAGLTFDFKVYYRAFAVLAMSYASVPAKAYTTAIPSRTVCPSSETLNTHGDAF